MKPERINTLCNAWYEEFLRSSTVGQNTEQYRLLINGIDFQNLCHESICTALTGLSKVLLLPNLNTVLDADHHFLWAWCGELLLNPRSNLFPAEQYEVKSLFETSIHAALAGCSSPPADINEYNHRQHIKSLQPHHAIQFIQKSNLTLAYLSFPLLEAVLKRACAAYVDLNGSVITDFSVTPVSGKVREYKKNKTCSSLRDLLLLHYDKVSNQTLKSHIETFRSNLQTLDPRDPFDLIYSWRNQSLHGTTNFQTIGGTLLNFAILISIFEIENDFEAYQIGVLSRWQHFQATSFRAPSDFFPPF